MTCRTTTENLARRVQSVLSLMDLTATIDKEGKGRSASFKVSCEGATQRQMDRAQDLATSDGPITKERVFDGWRNAPAAEPAATPGLTPAVALSAGPAQMDAPAAATDLPPAVAAEVANLIAARTAEATAAATNPKSATEVIAAQPVAPSANVGTLAQLKDDLVTLAAALIAAGQHSAANDVDRAISKLGAPATDLDVMGVLRLIEAAGGEINFGKVNKFRTAWTAARDAGLVIYWWPDRSKGAPAAATRLTDAGKAKLAGSAPAPAAAASGRRASRGRRTSD